MVDSDHPEAFGGAKLVPASHIVAGEYGTWRLVYQVGVNGIQRGGRIEVETDTDTDWGLPQVNDPAADEYLTVETPEGSGAMIHIVSNKKQLFTVTKRALTEGETITITYGDRTGGNRGSRAQTYAESVHFMHVRVDAEGDGRWNRLPDSPNAEIIGGPPSRMCLQVESTVTVNEEFSILLRIEDQWGNPASMHQTSVELSAETVRFPTDAVAFKLNAVGIAKMVGCVATVPGVHRIRAQDRENGMQAESNPMHVHETSPELRLCWGDLHGGQIADSGKIEQFFRYGRDIAGIDFVGYQRNDHAMSPEDYRVQQRLEREYYSPGSFVPLPGYEWSAGTDLGGHHNIFFRRFDQPARRSSHRALTDKAEQQMDLPHITDVYKAYRGSDVMITPHVGGEHSDLAHHDPLLEPALEVTSDHGSFHWFLEQAINKGYRMGFLGGSDSHNGRPGHDQPGFQTRRYSKSGITGLFVKELSIEGVFEAVRARRCFATTGARMLASATVDGLLMGSEYQTRVHPTITASIEGTAPIEELVLFRGVEQIYQKSFVSDHKRQSLRISWEGAGRESSYSGLIWDGHLSVHGGSLTAIRSFRFDSPRSHFEKHGDFGVSWHSWTCGYRSGIIIDLDSDALVEMSIVTQSLTRVPFGGRDRFEEHVAYAPRDAVRISVRPSDLEGGIEQIRLGELDRTVTVELEPVSRTSYASLEFTDESPVFGVNPYWIRMLQLDGEMLWTSPIFVDYSGEPLQI